MTDRTPPRRPALWEPALTQRIHGGPDPELVAQAAHDSARALLVHGRGGADRAVKDRLIELVEREGIEVVANVWAHTAPTSLPGALYRLYAVREWIRLRPENVARLYNRGLERADVAQAIAGVPAMHGPAEVRETIDRIFAGVFDGDLDVAFDRTAALLRVVVAGRGDRPGDPLARTAAQLATAARAQREGALFADPAGEGEDDR